MYFRPAARTRRKAWYDMKPRLLVHCWITARFRGAEQWTTSYLRNYTTLHYTTLHYTTLHYGTLWYTTLQYTKLQYTKLHYTTLWCTTLCYTTLCYTTRSVHYTGLNCTTLHYTALNFSTLHYTALHYTALHYTALHCRLLDLIKIYSLRISSRNSDTWPYITIRTLGLTLQFHSNIKRWLVRWKTILFCGFWTPFSVQPRYWPNSSKIRLVYYICMNGQAKGFSGMNYI
jgi:hypothetical protein